MANWGERDERAHVTLMAAGATRDEATFIVEQQRKARHASKRVVVQRERDAKRVTATHTGQIVAVPEQGFHRPYRVVGSTHIGAGQTVPSNERAGVAVERESASRRKALETMIALASI